MPLETRGLVAQWDPGREHLTVWGAALVTHYHRRVLSRLLELPVHRITMRSTDAGGNFGVRGDFFPEDFLVPFLAIRTGRPVKWTEDRAEHLVATNHAREQQHRHRGRVRRPTARLLGLRDEMWHNKGAYIRPTGIVVSEISMGMLPWPYRVPAYEGTDPRRHHEQDAGRPLSRARALRGHVRARGAVQRRAAHELGRDGVALRRMNLLDTADLPHEPDLSVGGEAFVLNSGDYRRAAGPAVCESADFEAWRAESAAHAVRAAWSAPAWATSWTRAGSGSTRPAGIDVDTDGDIRLLSAARPRARGSRR